MFRTLAVAAATLSLVLASNAIIHPGWGEVVNAGNTFDITWDPTTSISQVNLVLRAGDSQNLTTLYTIASGVENNGKYSWAVPGEQQSQTSYSIVIEDSSNSGDVNYSPYFTILKEGEGITSSSGASSGLTSRATSGQSVASGSASAGSAASSVAGSSVAVSSGASAGSAVSGSAASASGSAARSSAAGSASGSASGSATRASGSTSGSASGSASSSASGSTSAAGNGANLVGVPAVAAIAGVAAYLI